MRTREKTSDFVESRLNPSDLSTVIPSIEGELTFGEVAPNPDFDHFSSVTPSGGLGSL